MVYALLIPPPAAWRCVMGVVMGYPPSQIPGRHSASPPGTSCACIWSAAGRTCNCQTPWWSLVAGCARPIFKRSALWVSLWGNKLGEIHPCWGVNVPHRISKSKTDGDNQHRSCEKKLLQLFGGVHRVVALTIHLALPRDVRYIVLGVILSI